MSSAALVCLLLAGATAACGAAQRFSLPGGFEAPHGRHHPLVGRVWSREVGGFVDPDALAERVRRTPLMLIGESHDNPDHHRLEGWLVARFLSTHAGGAVGFEMLDESQAPALRPPPKTPAELAERVRWSESGWPAFAIYEPVFDAALEGGGRIVAAHPSKERVRASMHAVSAEEQRALKLEEPLPEQERAVLVREIEESHCGHAPAAMVDAMVRAQSYKDAFMARALTGAGGPAVLVAGRGHVSEMRGVPLFLARRGVTEVLTVALLEVDDARVQPQAYQLAPYDFALFTPRVSDADPCEQFREQLERMRRAHGSAGGEHPAAQ